MTCQIAENRPLRFLQASLAVPHQCHSRREHCIQGLAPVESSCVLGTSGTAIGYCQALFNYHGNARDHTLMVMRILREIKAPWAMSHELFWGYRTTEAPGKFVEDGLRPLIGTGRVPVCITALDPYEDYDTIWEIFSTTPNVPPGECVLLRLMAKSGERAQRPLVKLVKRLVTQASKAGEMPRWWPLFQTDESFGTWADLRRGLGDNWKYLNVAINPFTGTRVLQEASEQITVAQIPIGLEEGIARDGTITLEPEMHILGARKAGERWNIFSYFEKLKDLPVTPTLIILGPSRPAWTPEMNARRISRLLPILREACDKLWGTLGHARRDFLWSLES
jgi:hypothetical protein